jgi:hypothetical protein
MSVITKVKKKQIEQFVDKDKRLDGRVSGLPRDKD